MAQINPYLIFNGNCEEAFNFYKSVFGGDFSYLGRFGDMPPMEGKPVSEVDKNKVMHVSLSIGDTVLMGSDAGEGQGKVEFGNNFHISLNADSRDEADKMFNALSDGGQAFMPMDNTFWGAYFGMLQDKFKINWMINYDEKPQQ